MAAKQLYKGNKDKIIIFWEILFFYLEIFESYYFFFLVQIKQ